MHPGWREANILFDMFFIAYDRERDRERERAGDNGDNMKIIAIVAQRHIRF